MFTGIIEGLGKVATVQSEGSSKRFTIEADFTNELKVDQSVCHNGVCLTVVRIDGRNYDVQVVDETLQRSNLGSLRDNDQINLERSLKIGSRLDGHFVYGHVDQTATCCKMEDNNGSWNFEFEYDPAIGNITVEKGSICINGVSLTVVKSEKGFFSVAIIPYTFEQTNFKNLNVGDAVNLEFDIIGKYVKQISGQ